MKYTFKTQSKNLDYNNLLDFLQSISEEFMLVKQKQFEFNKTTELLLNDLRFALINRKCSDKWPGTQLLDNKKAEIFHFKVNTQSLNIIKKYSNSLFGWLAPELPEDLAFFRKDGSLVFGSIIHEGECWLDLNDREAEVLEKKFSGLKKNFVISD